MGEGEGELCPPNHHLFSSPSAGPDLSRMSSSLSTLPRRLPRPSLSPSTSACQRLALIGRHMSSTPPPTPTSAAAHAAPSSSSRPRPDVASMNAQELNELSDSSRFRSRVAERPDWTKIDPRDREASGVSVSSQAPSPPLPPLGLGRPPFSLADRATSLSLRCDLQAHDHLTDRQTLPVQSSSTNGTRVFYLNRPKKLNALNTEMVDLLSDSLDNWSASRLAKIVIGKGNGGKAFCAGGDITRQSASPSPSAPHARRRQPPSARPSSRPVCRALT